MTLIGRLFYKCNFLVAHYLRGCLIYNINKSKNTTGPWLVKYKQFQTVNLSNMIQHLPWTAIQSFKSSPSGNWTTDLRFIPELRDAWACLCKEYRRVPGENFFLGRKVCQAKHWYKLVTLWRKKIYKLLYTWLTR